MPAAKPKPAPKTVVVDTSPERDIDYFGPTLEVSDDAPLAEVPGGARVLKPTVRTFARQVLFEFNGRKWTIPEDFDRSCALEYLHMARTRGIDVAIDYALELALGTDDYAAFRRIKGLDQEQMDWVVNTVSGRVAGAGGNVPK